jgi:hypothetical protein
MVQGPARRRSGTRYIAPIKSSNNRGWLTPFRFNITQSYVLDWGDYSLRFYTNRGQVTGPNQPVWTATTTVDGALTWTNRGYPRWAAQTAYALNAVILDRNGQIEWCTTAGTSGANYPSFTTWGATNPDGTTVPVDVPTADGSVVWTCISVPQWQPNRIYNLTDTIYTDAGIMQVTAGGGGNSGPGAVQTPYEIPTPYSIASLTDAQGCFALDFVESFDVIYIAHESAMYPPYKLERMAGAVWRFILPIFQGVPFAPANPNDTIAVYASAISGNNVTLTASANIFPPTVIGAQFYLEQQEIRNITAWEPGAPMTKGELRRYLFVTYKAIQVGVAGKTGTAPPTHTQGSAWDGSSNGHVLWEYQDPGYGSVQITAVGTPTPTGNVFPITGATAANPVVISAPGHNFFNGQVVFISGVQGMTDIDNNYDVVAGVAVGTCALNDTTGAGVNGTAFAPYTGGGTVSSMHWNAAGNVISQLPASVVGSDNSTSFWAFGAWSTANGYPKCVKFFEDRLFFGTDGFLWGSAAADYENFNSKDASGNVTAAQAISVIVPSKEPLQWMVGGQALAIGTSGGELATGAINDSEPLGPANTACKAQLTWGSKRIQAIQIGVDIYYVQTAGRKVRAYEFSFIQNQYQSADVTVLADHIGLGVNPANPAINNFIAMTYQQEPDSVLWCVRADGVLCGYSLNKEQDVTGWHRQLIGGGRVESICAIPSPDGTGSDLWMIVNRTINGATARYVEYLTPPFDYGMPVSSAFFVDAGLTYSGPPATVFTLPHLIGMTVDVLADGADAGQFVVAGDGTVTLPRPASVVSIGLPMPALIAKMRLETGSPYGAQYATQQGQTKRITNLTLRLLNTVGGFYGSWDNYEDNGITALDPIQYRDPTMLMDTAIPLFTGDTGDSPFQFPAGYDREARIMILADRPLPMTIVGLFPQFESQQRD